ncbi:MAG: PorT family protein [Bacteroidales bacterium]|jgi:opacity protein-like surface antigen|nr:PorT family protein [Bacteroidales bacterium]
MTKKYLFIISTLMLSCVYFSQAQEFKAGLFAGITPSQVDGDHQSGFYKVGFTGGLFVNRSLNKGKLQGEIAFTLKGSRPASKAVDYAPELSFSYIDLSVYYIIGVWGENLFLRAGVVPSVLIDNSTGGHGYYSYGNNASSEWRTFSTELSIGLDYHFSEHWSINAAYNYSAFSIHKGNLTFLGLRPAETNAHYNNYIKLYLAYQF